MAQEVLPDDAGFLREIVERMLQDLEEHVEECLISLAFPESHRRRIRTTNGLERFNQEL